jgi:DNA-binding HxlR family transcriptional regulator
LKHFPDRPSELPAGCENSIAWWIGGTGDEWTLQILRHAMHGARRYNDWQRALPISHAVLTSRLRRLEELGLLAAIPYQDRPPRLEYLLTPRGRDFWPVLVCIWAWEARWVADQPVIRDVHCGQLGQPLMTCGQCGEVVGARDVLGEFGPSGTWERSVARTTTRRRSAGSQQDPGLLRETTALVGNRWSAAMVGAAFFGARRFGEFQQRMLAPAAIVADRLRTFCAHGVLRAEDSTYRLTDKGRAFFPVVLAGIHWAERWFPAPEGPAMVFHHREHPFTPVLACDQCARPLSGTEVVIEPHATRPAAGSVPEV